MPLPAVYPVPDSSLMAMRWLAVVLVILGTGIIVCSPRLRRWPVVVGIIVVGFMLYGLMLPSVARVRPARPQIVARNNMKQLALAMHYYANEHEGRFPPATLYDKNGRPLLSWEGNQRGRSSLFEMAVNAKGAAVPCEMAGRIVAIQPDGEKLGVRCKLCGCLRSVTNRLPHETCPLGKWPA